MFQKIFEFVNNYFVLSITWLISLILMIVYIYKDMFMDIELITISELLELINKKNAVILDIRTHDQYLKGHIINAHHISWNSTFKEKHVQFKKYMSQPIIIVFQDSIIDKELISYLKSIGLNKIYVLKGGMYRWYKECYPIVVS